MYLPGYINPDRRYIMDSGKAFLKDWRFRALVHRCHGKAPAAGAQTVGTTRAAGRFLEAESQTPVRHIPRQDNGRSVYGRRPTYMVEQPVVPAAARQDR